MLKLLSVLWYGHVHEWEEVQSGFLVDGDIKTGFYKAYSCTKCRKNRMVKYKA